MTMYDELVSVEELRRFVALQIAIEAGFTSKLTDTLMAATAIAEHLEASDIAELDQGEQGD